MKRIVILAAAAAAVAFSYAGSAFAVNHSGQDRLGGAVPYTVDASGDLTAGGESALVSGTVVPGAGTYTYQDWNTSLGDNASGDGSPHGDYTTTTVKCAVCHTAHYAAPAGAPVTGGQQSADTLLRVQAGQACIYCHATAGVAVNGMPVYDGLGGALGSTGGATNTGHYTGTDCSECHTSVHGANADHSVASLGSFLLKRIPQAAVTTAGVPASDMIEAITAIDHQAVDEGFAPGAALAGTIGDYASSNTATLREQAIGVFCAECHEGAFDIGAAGAATNIHGSGSVAYSGHRIAATATPDWNEDRSKSSGLISDTTIAWGTPSTDCKSCHDATDRYGNIAFPHSWGGTKMWLMAAPDADISNRIALPYGTQSGSSYDAGAPQNSDGVCLKCHVAAGGTAGVGITF